MDRAKNWFPTCAGMTVDSVIKELADCVAPITIAEALAQFLQKNLAIRLGPRREAMLRALP